MREIVPGVMTWSIEPPHKRYPFNAYLVREGGGICVDPVEPDADAQALLQRDPPRTIVLTNRNHYRAAAAVRELTGARVAIHPADAWFVRERGVLVDDELAEGQRIGPLVVVGAPGKSPGEVALHWPERRLLLVGDACIGHPAGSLGLVPAAAIDDADLLRGTLARLAVLDVDTLLLGDGASILTGGRAALDELIARLAAPPAG